MPTSGSFLAAGRSIFAKRSGSRESIHNSGRPSQVIQALSLIVNPMPPRITEQSYRPRVSDRTMVATRTTQPFRLLRFRNRIEREFLLSLPVDRLRTVLAVKGSLRRAEDGAPLTAPGRSEEPYLIRRERRIGKSMTLTAQHLATFNRRDHVRATKPRGTCTAAGGWMPKISRLSARGTTFSLDIPFYRTGITAPG